MVYIISINVSLD